MDDSFVGMIVGVFAVLFLAMLGAAIAGEVLRARLAWALAFSRSETPWFTGQCAFAVMFASIAAIDVLEGKLFVGAFAGFMFAVSSAIRSSVRRRAAIGPTNP